MDRELDVFKNYRNINNNIKKRFLKKPNFLEAIEQFGTLSRFLKQQECPQYAGFCCLAKARCENTLNNPVAEAETLLEAARLFFEAELTNVKMKCPSLEEHLSEAILCYNQAMKVYIKEGNLSLGASVSNEVANNLVSIGKLDEAYNHFIQAAEIQKQFSIVDYLCTMQNASSCKLIKENYPVALRHLSQIALTIESMVTSNKDFLTYSLLQILQHVEITRVLASLLLKSSPMDLNDEHLKILEKYTWENRDNDPILPDNLFLLIQSVVMATQAVDGETLLEMEEQLFEFLDIVQMELLHRIVVDVNK
ncbi:40-kDa huntingtin-associated protein [Hydra vulgaris]|uniref:40-kDa huntingtin-associated protein n=1 Tax=Hydra vulgaris TaxID=6087 RepID=A0ABM4CXQ3_HYDVU